MPIIKWQGIEPLLDEIEYVVMGSRLPLTRMRTTPRFLAITRQVQKHLADADGLIGYTLNAQLMQKTYWTLSAWRDAESLRAFAGSAHHRQVMSTLGPLMDPTTFQTWTLTGRSVPLAWPAIMARITGD